MKTSNLGHKEFKTMIISRLKELRRMDKLRVRKCKEKPNKNEDYNN